MIASAVEFVAKLPRDVGGTEGSLAEQFAIIETLAIADGSHAWNCAFMASSAGIAAARLPDEGLAEIRDGHDNWPAFCGTFPMSGVATPVDGGFELRGRWGFGSGIRHAQWVACGARRTDTDVPVWFAVPVADAIIDDTWDSPGLAGTQSCDYEIRDVFVPHSRTFNTAGPPLRGGPLFRMPMQAYLTPDHTAITLGCARRALDECVAQARGKQRLGSASPLAQRAAFVHDLGRAHTKLVAARSHVCAVLDRLDTAEIVDAPLFLDARGAATYAAEVAVEVATFAYRNGGGHAVYTTSALGRAYRDAMTSSQHVHVLDDVYDWIGATLIE